MISYDWMGSKVARKFPSQIQWNRFKIARHLFPPPILNLSFPPLDLKIANSWEIQYLNLTPKPIILDLFCYILLEMKPHKTSQKLVSFQLHLSGSTTPSTHRHTAAGQPPLVLTDTLLLGNAPSLSILTSNDIPSTIRHTASFRFLQLIHVVGITIFPSTSLHWNMKYKNAFRLLDN